MHKFHCIVLKLKYCIRYDESSFLFPDYFWARSFFLLLAPLCVARWLAGGSARHSTMEVTEAVDGRSFSVLSMELTVLPTVADHKVTNGMGCQIWKENLVVKWFFNFSNIHLVGPFCKK